MYESTSDRPDATIKILIMGPNSKIDIPIMEAQFHISNNSGKIKASICTNLHIK